MRNWLLHLADISVLSSTYNRRSDRWLLVLADFAIIFRATGKQETNLAIAISIRKHWMCVENFPLLRPS